MNMGYSYNKPNKLHSPLLDGKTTRQRPELYNLSTNSKLNKQESLDDTLDLTLFEGKKNQKREITDESINYSYIEGLESLFKIASGLILSIGGLFCILELVKIVQAVQSGTPILTINIVTIVTVFIATITANTICLGFNHLVKTTKYLYARIDSQNAKLEKLLSKINS